MSFIEKICSCSTEDKRTKRLVPPASIVMARGAEGAEKLIGCTNTQPSLGENDCCVLTSDENGADILFDFGSELHGTFCFSICGISGAPNGRLKFRITLGESVSEAMSLLGSGSTATNDHSPREIYTDLGFYSCYETNQSGFRYARLTLLTPNASAELNGAQAGFIYNDIPYLGSFECSDETINRIYNTAAYTAHLNLQDYLWDGIKRDRLVWAGDMHTEVKTLLNTFGANETLISIIKKSLDISRDATPSGENMNGISSYSMWWINVHYELYRFLGDKDYLFEQKEYLSKLVGKLSEYVDENGNERVPEHRFLDWPTSPDANAIHCGLHALLYMTLRHGAELCHVLGADVISDKANAAADRLEKAVPELETSKQAASLLGLSGLITPEKANETILRRGETESTADGYSCFFGYYILAVKAMAGDIETALADMKEYWGGMLEMGATSFWEDFSLSWIKRERTVCPITRLPEDNEIDIHADYGAYCYKGLRHSLCHGWSSGPVPFITEYILGIKSVDVGMKTVSVKPNLAGLDFVKGSVPTPLGVIEIEAHNSENGTVTNIILPEGVSLLN